MDGNAICKLKINQIYLVPETNFFLSTKIIVIILIYRNIMFILILKWI